MLGLCHNNYIENIHQINLIKQKALYTSKAALQLPSPACQGCYLIFEEIFTKQNPSMWIVGGDMAELDRRPLAHSCSDCEKTRVRNLTVTAKLNLITEKIETWKYQETL